MYSLGVRTSNVTAANACLEIIAPPLTALDIMEIEIFAASTVATAAVGLGRPAAIGLVPTTPVALLSEDDPVRTTLAATALAWGTGPTVPANFFRRTFLPAVGNTARWIFQDGLAIPAGGSIVLWNIATSCLLDVTVKAVER